MVLFLLGLSLSVNIIFIILTFVVFWFLKKRKVNDNIYDKEVFKYFFGNDNIF